MSATPIPIGFARMYATLAEIARERAKAERERDRLVLEAADEIAREQPPPPPLRHGVEVMRGMTYIEEEGIQ